MDAELVVCADRQSGTSCDSLDVAEGDRVSNVDMAAALVLCSSVDERGDGSSRIASRLGVRDKDGERVGERTMYAELGTAEGDANPSLRWKGPRGPSLTMGMLAEWRRPGELTDRGVVVSESRRCGLAIAPRPVCSRTLCSVKDVGRVGASGSPCWDADVSCSWKSESNDEDEEADARRSPGRGFTSLRELGALFNNPLGTWTLGRSSICSSSLVPR